MYLCREGGVSYLCSPQVRRLRREDHHPVHNSSRLVSTQSTRKEERRRGESRGGGEEEREQGRRGEGKYEGYFLFSLLSNEENYMMSALNVQYATFSWTIRQATGRTRGNCII